MKQKKQENEFEAGWQSVEWLIRERLEAIHRITEKMISSMITLGVKQELIADELPKKFEQLRREVVDGVAMQNQKSAL